MLNAVLAGLTLDTFNRQARARSRWANWRSSSIASTRSFLAHEDKFCL
jgi:hypothetical protein